MNTDVLNRMRGSLIGGAAGDALGYAVEFDDAKSIFKQYGSQGITEYTLDRGTGKALISDDTQMTLFTAAGLLGGNIDSFRYCPRNYVEKAYLDWYNTQMVSFGDRAGSSWLCDVPQLYARRAPGNTCLSALSTAKPFKEQDYIAHPRNNSKGCGGVMRVAPVGMWAQMDIELLDMEAAQIAAITHGHPLGYIPAAVLCHIVNRLVFHGTMGLKDIVLEAMATAEKLFHGNMYIGALRNLVDRAVALAENNEPDLDNIQQLGEGWVGEEALAIAIYCSLRYSNDFSGALIAAVNHSGDSDSTGAVTGNILGARIGYDAIDEKWKTNLECADVLLEVAEDLAYGCRDEATWKRKYAR